jgi:hypothetical protein
MNVGEIHRFKSEDFGGYDERLHVIVTQTSELYVIAKNIHNFQDVKVIYKFTFSSWEKVS